AARGFRIRRARPRRTSPRLRLFLFIGRINGLIGVRHVSKSRPFEVEPSVGVERNFVPVIARDDLVAQAIAAGQMNIGTLHMHRRHIPLGGSRANPAAGPPARNLLRDVRLKLLAHVGNLRG
ncbi:MAG: hypothetical protein WA792_16865, partial [Pseudolabrys sp.]